MMPALWPRHRLIFGAAFGAAAFALIGVQVMTLSMMEGTSGYRKTASAEVPVRGRILDRKGRVLAASLPAFELYADPAEVMNPVKGAITLASLLPNTTEEKSTGKADPQGDAMPSWPGRLRPPLMQGSWMRALSAFMAASASPGSTHRNLRRPMCWGWSTRIITASPVFESGFNETLARGEDVHLSIDLEVQAILRREISKQIEQFEAIGGAGVVIDVKTGELISLVSLPDFDPQHLCPDR